MSIKLHINKVHGSLCDLFGEVSIQEKSSLEKGQYFELIAEKDGIKAVIEIGKIAIESQSFDWGYYANPLERGYLVERKSNLETIASDLSDIFDKKRFDSDYLNEITK
jgi:hypothetical protein